MSETSTREWKSEAIIEVAVPGNRQLVRFGISDDFHLKSPIEVIIIVSPPRHRSSLVVKRKSAQRYNTSSLHGRWARASSYWPLTGAAVTLQITGGAGGERGGEWTLPRSEPLAALPRSLRTSHRQGCARSEHRLAPAHE